MNENANNESNFIGYEYKDVTVKRDMEAIYADSYPNFGWILDGTSSALQGITAVTLKFKRNRKMPNKAEVTRLQRQFEGSTKEIERLGLSKVAGASTAAYLLGILGTACMAGAVFSYLGAITPLFIILGILGFAGWIIPYFSYNSIKNKKTEIVSPMIDKQYDTIYDICEKANTLLSN